MKDITFITGNQDKADYLARHIGVDIAHQKVELDELQSVNLDNIVMYKVKQAYQIIQSPVLVEDVGLAFNALNGLPGPFVKFFVDYAGLEASCRMLDGFSDRSALANSVFGYYDGSTLKLFHGSLAGAIAEHPRGDGGFGWDQIFIPDGYDGKTRAELSPADDEKTYATIKPFAELREFLRSR